MLGFHTLHFRKHRLMASVFWLLLAAIFASASFAQENIAVYPPLPAGYTSIRVFDNQGRFAGRILPAQRYWAGIDKIPVFLQQALIAIEDARFYEHSGIDMRGIARALVKDVIKGRMAEGGSTITQQLIKNKYFHGEKTITRKGSWPWNTRGNIPKNRFWRCILTKCISETEHGGSPRPPASILTRILRN